MDGTERSTCRVADQSNARREGRTHCARMFLFAPRDCHSGATDLRSLRHRYGSDFQRFQRWTATWYGILSVEMSPDNIEYSLLFLFSSYVCLKKRKWKKKKKKKKK